MASHQQVSDFTLSISEFYDQAKGCDSYALAVKLTAVFKSRLVRQSETK